MIFNRSGDLTEPVLIRHPSRSSLLFVLGMFLALALAATSALAESVTTPIHIATASNEGPTLGIPRWKGYVSELDPDNIWCAFGSGGTSSSSMVYSTDAGATWSSSAIQIDFTGSLDMHLSVVGQSENLFCTFPGSAGQGICYRQFDYPSHSNDDRGSLIVMPGTGSGHRSNVMVQPSGRVWVFTRLGDSPSENVRYHYTDNGVNFTSGVAYATNASDVRIGSMPYVDGNPALVVLHIGDSRGYEYYLWNGSSFEARPDHSIFAQNMGSLRVFTHNVVNDTTMHLIFGMGNNMYHLWKNYNGGSGGWNQETVESSTYTVDFDWYPISTVRGDNLYLFYCKKSSSSDASSEIYYMRWTQSTESWTDPVHVSTGVGSGSTRDPNTCFQVPMSADYIPVYWRAGGSPYDLYFAKVLVDATEIDTIAPGRVIDLGAASGSSPGEVDLNWTAPGDDDMIGTADRYEIRQATSVIDDDNWISGTVVSQSITPLPSGQTQTFTATGLTGGEIRYFALKAYDEANNGSPVSNFAFTLVTDTPDIDDGPILPKTARLTNTYPNPFNNSTQIQYSIPSLTHVMISIYDLLGQRVTTLVNSPMTGGDYRVEWRGNNDSGKPVASGVYFCRLTTESAVDSHKLVLLK